MILSINGKDEKLEERSSLDSLVSNKGLNRERVIIEHNLEIIPRGRWQDVFPSDGDKIEIVKFMGGG